MSDCVWIHYSRPRPPWYELPEAERAALRQVWEAVAGRSQVDGGQRLGTWHVRGQADFSTVEIWRFAGVEQAFDHWARLTAVGYGDWFAFANSVGWAQDADP